MDQKDNVFQLENRLYVFPDHSEVKHCIVFGEGWEHVGAPVVPDPDNIGKKSSTVDSTDFNSAIKSAISSVNNESAPRGQLNFEIVNTGWKRSNKYLTPTRKKRREVIKNDYGDKLLKLQE